VQCRYLRKPYTPKFSSLLNWHTWQRYETKEQAEQACQQLNKSHGMMFGSPWMEFRVGE